jgi:ribosomal protein RSM22 (predicted rRNA methylase)
MSTTPPEIPPRQVTLPDELVASIERALAKTPTAQWLREAQALSERYRAPRSQDSPPLATGNLQALSYTALVMPATYAQLRGALAATAARIPNWQPQTMLDLGSGPGTALWAATEQWPTLRSLAAWEREPAFIALGRELLRGSTLPAMRTATWQRVDLQQAPTTNERYDLVILGHVLNELRPETQAAVVAAAWQRTSGLLLIIEPGTSAAFPVVRAARDQLLASSAHTIAPCAHDNACPLADDWCHFPQRLIRPAFQRQARGAPSQWEDSKFSYAAMARFAPDTSMWGRIIREPTSNKAYAEAVTSTREGITTYRALKRHKDTYHVVRKLRWGATISEPPNDPIMPIDHERTT